MKIKTLHIKFFIISLISIIPLAMQGGFADSQVYYEQAVYTWANGLKEGILGVYEQTGKLEFGMQILFYFEGVFSQNKIYFIIVNCMIVNFCLYSILLKSHDSNNIVIKSTTLFLLFFSYFIYSNTLYVWRTVLALYFFYLCIRSSEKNKRVFFLIVSVTFHYTAVLFALLYYIARYLPNKKLNNILLVFVIIIFSYIIINNFSVIKYFVSGGNETIFLQPEGEYIKRLIINFSFLIVLLLTSTQNFDRNMFNLFKMCILLCALSIVFFNNWQLSWRLFAPSALLGIPLILAYNKNNYAVIIIAASILPSIKLMALLLQGLSP
ncbi:EpsG family protein [Citrobacter sedlakii]|uniref:EpsG family protein n=1 Tax=Citrobacter sedlakii TaxID=67826 RepID=UPI003B235780